MNADDFGLDENINKGIVETCNNGIVRSVSIVSNGSAFEHALNLIKRHAGIGIGVHLCLVNEASILPKEKIPTLVDNNGLFPINYRQLFFRIYNNKINLAEIRKELEAQIERLLDNSIIPAHLDSHQYTHLIPQVFNIVIDLAKKYSIKWIRYPTQDRYIEFLSIENLIKKVCLLFSSSYQLSLLRKNGIGCADFSFGTMTDGHLNEYILNKFLNCLQSGLSDITCHPGYTPKDAKYLTWKYNWAQETNALASQRTKEMPKELNIQLTNYALL